MRGVATFAVLVLAGLGLSGCASASYDDSAVQVSALPHESGTSHGETQPGQKPLQCVPYAREHSQIKIFGDAYTWWDQAAGKYQRGTQPAAGAVMVLFDYAGPDRGHVAVVRRLVSAREIRVDHANWLDDGAIYVNDPVADVSAANDWSQIRVWNIKTGGWGTKIFPVQGFISTRRPGDDANDRVADADDGAAPTMGQSAAIGAAPPSAPFAAPFAPGDRDPAPGSEHGFTADDLAIP